MRLALLYGSIVALLSCNTPNASYLDDEPDLGMPDPIYATLLRSARLQTELGMSDVTKRDVVRLCGRVERLTQNAMDDSKKVAETQRERRLDELLKPVRDEWKQSLPRVLTASQIRRYRQIDLQYREFFACEDEEIAKALSLSDGQRQSIREAVVEFRSALQEVSMIEPQERMALQSERRAIALRRIESILTRDQQTVWKRIIGKPYE